MNQRQTKIFFHRIKVYYAKHAHLISLKDRPIYTLSCQPVRKALYVIRSMKWGKFLAVFRRFPFPHIIDAICANVYFNIYRKAKKSDEILNDVILKVSVVDSIVKLS